MKFFTAKKMMAVLLPACIVFTMAGCTRSVSAAAYKTVNGVTEGNYEVSTDDKGSASFDVHDNHVEMTNFSFDADPSLKVEAEIEEEDLVYTQVLVHDGESIMQNVADGLYPEVFEQEGAADQFNTIYQIVLGGSDEPFTEDIISLESGVLVGALNLTDGQMFLLAKEGTNQFISVAATTAEYGSQDIIDAAFDSLKDESAAEAEEELFDDEEMAEAEDAVIPEEDTETIYEYPVYSHETDDPFYAPACQYIMETCGSQFEPEEIMIPVVDILRVDDSDPEDILVWGNYWVYNFALRGTTLMNRSGGNFPGIIHMKEDGDTYTGFDMDLVESGSDYDSSIEELFGVDDELRNAFAESTESYDLFMETLRWYRDDTGLDIEASQDFGWDPDLLDPDEDAEFEYPDLAGTWVADGVEMEITNPDEGNVYGVVVNVEQDDGSNLRFDLFGEYEYSTIALYYWDGTMTVESEEGTADEGNDAEGYFDLMSDESIIWYSANHDTEVLLERAE